MRHISILAFLGIGAAVVCVTADEANGCGRRHSTGIYYSQPVYGFANPPSYSAQPSFVAPANPIIPTRLPAKDTPPPAGNANAQSPNKVPDADIAFVREAASGGTLEVKLGQLATERAMNPDVRKFGQHMVTDHTNMAKDLMALAEKKGITVPKDMNQKHQAAFDRFKDLKGAEFDRAYMKSMVKDHEEDTDDFAKEAKDGKDADVKAFANRSLPIIKEHLRMAREISGTLP